MSAMAALRAEQARWQGQHLSRRSPCRTQAARLLTATLICTLLFASMVSDLDNAQRSAFLRVALTREEGQNGKLRALLEKAIAAESIRDVELVEIPCIEHGDGGDLEEVVQLLSGSKVQDAAFPADVIVLTSPEGARVFLRALDEAALQRPPVPIATVGKGTTAILSRRGLDVAFEPSKANAETLAAELPADLGPRVMYLSSAIAPGTLQQGLEARGFEIMRLNTYTTRGVKEVSSQQKSLMDSTEIVTFGSPSAVRSWAQLCNRRALAACIGGTSEAAAKEAGFEKVLAPSSPGVPGWAEVTMSAVQDLLREDVE
mmetsp:Transcript_43628/g.79540  ORF Transcript_43628/g.79540 Transcript_43628/m.79540 type:complete len:316 (-) Transcript_43628:27-974(-)